MICVVDTIGRLFVDVKVSFCDELFLLFYKFFYKYTGFLSFLFILLFK
jgi:hypothetical protein